MTTTTAQDLTTATPVEIDTRLAEIHRQLGALNHKISSLTNRVLDRAGLRIRHSATWQTRKVTYTVTGTFEDGVAILTAYSEAFEAWIAAGYPSDQRPTNPGGAMYTGSTIDVEELVAERRAAVARRLELWADANVLQGEYLSRPWPRYYLVTSSAGHIHSHTDCQTCRRTTEFGWMPERSGQTEAEAIADLGDYAESLCSVCYPNAPVDPKRKHITKAKAEKLSAGEFVRE